MKREDIPGKLDVFMKGLEKLLGSGAVVIEKAVAKNLCSNAGKNYRPKINSLE